MIFKQHVNRQAIIIANPSSSDQKPPIVEQVAMRGFFLGGSALILMRVINISAEIL